MCCFLSCDYGWACSLCYLNQIPHIFSYIQNLCSEILLFFSVKNKQKFSSSHMPFQLPSHLPALLNLPIYLSPPDFTKTAVKGFDGLLTSMVSSQSSVLDLSAVIDTVDHCILFTLHFASSSADLSVLVIPFLLRLLMSPDFLTFKF